MLKETNAIHRLITRELAVERDSVALALWRGERRRFQKLFIQGRSDQKQPTTSLRLSLAHLAAIRGDLSSLDFLKEMGETFSCTDARGFLPCHHAAAHLRGDLFEFFKLFDSTSVAGTLALTPAAIRGFITPPSSRLIRQNYWSFDALYFSVRAGDGSIEPFLELESAEPIKHISKMTGIGRDIKAGESIREGAVVGTYDGQVTLGAPRLSIYSHGRFFQTDAGELVIDGLRWHSLGCLFNDSAPNLYKETVIDPRNGLPRILFRALRRIEKGESLTWNYGATHIVKYLPRRELQRPFIQSFIEKFWLRIDSEEFRNIVAGESYFKNIEALREVEMARYLDSTLHTLAELAARNEIQAVHLKWIAAVTKKHPKPGHQSFSPIIHQWLQTCSEDEKLFLLKSIPRATSLEILNLLLRKKNKWKELSQRVFLKTIQFIGSRKLYE